MARAGPEIAYGSHTGILSIARARCELKQLCCYVNPDFSVKMSDESEYSDSEFYYPKKDKNKKKDKCCAHMIKCLLTELGLAGRENIWPEVIALGPYAMTSGQLFSRPALPLSQ